VQGWWFGVWGLGFRVSGFGFQGVGFRGTGVWFMVQGLGFRLSTPVTPAKRRPTSSARPPGSPGPEMPAPHVLLGFGVWDLRTLRCTSGADLRLIRPERILPLGALEPYALPVPRDLQVAIPRAVQRELPDADSD
jgi:hypothetical protein